MEEFPTSRSIYKSERENQDEITVRHQPTVENMGEGKFRYKFEFPNFSVVADLGENNLTYKIEFEAGGKTYNFLADLPDDYKFLMTFYPSGKVFSRKREIRGILFDSVGSILSNSHEKGHVKYQESRTPEELDKNLSIFGKLQRGEPVNEEERNSILEEEQFAWDEVRSEIKKIEETLGITIVQDESVKDSYIQRRLDTYAKLGHD